MAPCSLNENYLIAKYHKFQAKRGRVHLVSQLRGSQYQPHVTFEKDVKLKNKNYGSWEKKKW